MTTWQCEYRVQPPGQPVKWLFGISTPEKLADGSIVWHGFNADITLQKQAEAEREKLHAQLYQSQKMEAIGRLAGGVAHDFNNMLGVMVGYAELALTKINPDHPLYVDLSEILKAGQRSADLTHQLLGFARCQAISPHMIDLNDTIDGMLKMLRRLIGENIDLAWQPGADLWPVLMDPTQINQVLANLCVNAQDAISDVGTITIKTKNIRLDPFNLKDHLGVTPGEYVKLTVQDDGCGMNKETQEHLFEPFFSTKSTAGKRFGLGLATVYGIVTQNGGFVDVCSKPGMGSTFLIYLPGHKGAVLDSRRSAEDPDPPTGNGETVLVVEDEASICLLCQKVLEGLNYCVLTAESPKAAIDLVQAYPNPIQLLISDLVMPQMSGQELSEQIQTFYPNLKTILMSGYAVDMIGQRHTLDENVNFIAKPFSRYELADKVKEVLGCAG